MSLSATVIRDILYTASSYGTAYDQLIRLAGFSEKQIADSERMVDLEKVMRLWKLLGELIGEERIGLKMGQAMNIRMVGMLGFLMQSCATIEQVLQVVCRYSFTVCPLVEFRYSKQGRKAVLELHQNKLWAVQYPKDSWENIDFSLTSSLNFVRALSGQEICPISVATRAPRKGVEDYRSFFRCPVSFNSDVAQLVFTLEDIQKPVLGFDKPLYEFFNNILAQKKDAFMQNSCSKALKQQLIMRFKGQIPTIEKAAESLNLTIRSLQRRLAEENTSYRSITNEVKKELALQLMNTPSHNISDVAQILGYSDLPAFRKAFKSWTNETPTAVKRKFKQQLYNSTN